MLLSAARELDLDLAHSWMIGDELSDMDAARNAGVRGILVRTGFGAEQLATLAQQAGFAVVDALPAAFEIIRSASPAALPAES